jgi:hypothetical protein
MRDSSLTNTQVFWMPKAGNTLAEYEDAFWPRYELIRESGPVRLAVADGATETSFSGLWARLLVSSFGRGRLMPDSFPAEIQRIRRVWRHAVGQKPLPWYAEEKLRSGAFSSLLGLTLLAPEIPVESTGEWQATAIGDSCLLQARHGALVCSFPFSHSDEFNSRPRLLSSLDGDDSADLALANVSGRWQAGDSFYLMTDALAAWSLRRLESNDDVFERLNSLQIQTDFESLVEQLRSTRDGDGVPLLKNDDVSLVRCTIASETWNQTSDGHSEP